MKKFTMLFTLSLGALFNTAAVAEDNGLHGTVIVGAATAPEYEGSSDNTFVPIVAGRINDNNRYLSFEGPTIRANVIESKWLEFGPVVNVTTKRGRDINSLPVSRLGRIKDAVEVGAFVATSRAIHGNDRIRFAVQAVQDVSSVHKGWLGGAQLSYDAAVNSKLCVLTNLSASYVNAEYSRTYFTVSGPGSASSGLAAFNAKAGIKDLGGSMTVRYTLSERWSVIGFGAYKKLVGSFANSPIIKDAGSPNQFVGALGVGFSF